jgi:hypothetical protein
MNARGLLPALTSAVGCLVAVGGEAATVLTATFDTPDQNWKTHTLGQASCALVNGGLYGGCLRVAGAGGLGFYSRELPLEASRGAKLSVRCQVKLDDVRRGPQTCSVAKVLLSVATPAGTQHFAARGEGTTDWHQESLLAEVPQDATRVLLSLGLENAAGTAFFDALVVQNDRRGAKMLDLTPAANRGFVDEIAGDGKGGFTDDGPNDLRELKPGVLEWKGIPFRLADPKKGKGLGCVVLKGEERPGFPESPPKPVPVGVSASKLYVLHAAAWGKESRETPCVIYDLKYWDGRVAHLSIFEGREIGPLNSDADLDNWKVAWKGKNGKGELVALGVTEWTVYDTTPIESLSARTYRGAVPVIVAVTAVQEPPPAPSATDYSEGEGES